MNLRVEDVTVLVVCYDQEKFVPAAISSISTQIGVERIPILFCDDRSSDRSADVARRELARFPLASVRVNECNLGVMGNYRTAIRQIETPLVAILEADDLWVHPSNLIDKVAFLNERSDVDCVFSGYTVVDAKGRTISQRDRLFGVNRAGFLHFDELLRDNLIGTFSNCMYRTEALRGALDAAEGLDGYDWLVNLLIARQNPIGFVGGTYTSYLVSEAGTWSRMSEARKAELMRNTLRSVAEHTEGRLRQMVQDRIEGFSRTGGALNCPR